MVTHIIHYVDEGNIHCVCCAGSWELSTFISCVRACVTVPLHPHARSVL